MGNPKKTTVVILGAGCSATAGYPVAESFVEGLAKFVETLGEHTARVKECAVETVDLMRKHNVATIDDLTVRIHEGALDSPSERGPVALQVREQRIRSARIATAAMFLFKEKAARETGLRSYHELIHEVLPPTDFWEDRFRNTGFHVLTFNYDRLFEIAFHDRLNDELRHSYGIYSTRLLNSGLNLFGDSVAFDENRFSYLKLHGSIGATASFNSGGVSYQPFDGHPFAAGEITDTRFFGDVEKVMPGLRCPLIVFPFEKQRVRSGGKHDYFAKYIDAVWGRAKSLVSLATEIRVIGYSFQALDRKALIGLLAEAKNCDRCVIQNLPGVSEEICSMLKSKHREINIPLEAFASRF